MVMVWGTVLTTVSRSSIYTKLPQSERQVCHWCRYFWRGSEWELFLDPVKGGFAVARTAPQAYSCTHLLMDQPGQSTLPLAQGCKKQTALCLIAVSSSDGSVPESPLNMGCFTLQAYTSWLLSNGVHCRGGQT